MSESTLGKIAIAIQQIDELIEKQLDEILHHPKFQALESNWRSLLLLCNESYNQNNILIRCLDAKWKEISKDVTSAVEFDQSALFHIIYTREFGMPGGIPYSVLIGAYEVSHMGNKDADDVETLRAISHIAAAAFAPFLTNAAPSLLGLEEFGEIDRIQDLTNTFERKEYLRWNQELRNISDCRFLGICLPKILIRKPYSSQDCAQKGLRYDEQARITSASELCFTYSSFAFALVLIREFSRVSWFTHVRGTPRDTARAGAVDQFPYLDAHPSDSDFQINTEVRITETLEKKLAEVGLIALYQSYGSPLNVFLSNPSIHDSKILNDRLASANANVSAMLQQVLCASRFAHYIKVMIRDKVGSFVSAEDCQQLLESWLANYTSGRQDLDWEGRAKYPLRAYKVRVYEQPMSPGNYSCSIDLQPHYQAEHLLSELKLTTELLQVAAA